MVGAKARSGEPVQDTAISDQEIALRKEFLDFKDDDVERLRSISQLAREYADEVIEELYAHFLAFKDTRAFLEDPRVLERVKRLQRDYFLRLTQGDYGSDYVQNRVAVGAVHERIGLDVKWYLGAYRRYMESVLNRLIEAFRGDPERVFEIYRSLKKLMFLDIGLALDTYITQREKTIREQQEAIRELSTPVLQLRERLLILPIVGMIDTARARQLTENLLRAIRANRAKVIVIDVTGVPSVDSKVANHIVQTVEASRLMGATVIVSGLSPEVATALVTLGVELTRINTVGDLQGGIEEAERILGYTVVKAGEPSDGSRE